MPTEMHDYLFDLRGYVVVEGAISASEAEALNARLDELIAEPKPPDPDVRKQKGYENFGRSLGNVVEQGTVFEWLIDHPSWIATSIDTSGIRTGPF